MKLRKILFTFLLFVAFDQLFGHLIFDEPRTFFRSVTSSLFISLFLLIPTKSKKQLDEQFIRESGFILSPDETLKIGTTANKLVGSEAEGGKLFLTNRRLVFVSNKNDKSTRQQDFDRTRIASVERHPEFPKAIVILTKENTSHAFIVDRHQQWMDSLATL